jgi:hypothetical protein
MSQRSGNASSDAPEAAERVVDFNEVREQRLAEKKRQNERILFKNLLSVYTMVGQSEMLPVELVDVSEDGCSFHIPFDPENRKIWPNDIQEFPLRLYFSQDTFLEVIAKIHYSRSAIENNQRYTRYGCSIDTTVKSYPAYQAFVRFLKFYSEHAHKDKGEVTVFYL